MLGDGVVGAAAATAAVDAAAAAAAATLFVVCNLALLLWNGRNMFLFGV